VTPELEVPELELAPLPDEAEPFPPLLDEAPELELAFPPVLEPSSPLDAPELPPWSSPLDAPLALPLLAAPPFDPCEPRPPPFPLLLPHAASVHAGTSPASATFATQVQRLIVALPLPDSGRVPGAPRVSGDLIMCLDIRKGTPASKANRREVAS
jgi:hypothetical protein